MGNSHDRRLLKRHPVIFDSKAVPVVVVNMQPLDATKQGPLDFANSIGVGALIVTVVFAIINPPLFLKIPVLLIVGLGLFYFARKSHWTHGWPNWAQYGGASVAVVILSVIAIPQLVPQRKNDYPKQVPLTATFPDITEPLPTAPLRELPQNSVLKPPGTGKSSERVAKNGTKGKIQDKPCAPMFEFTDSTNITFSDDHFHACGEVVNGQNVKGLRVEHSTVDRKPPQ